MFLVRLRLAMLLVGDTITFVPAGPRPTVISSTRSPRTGPTLDARSRSRRHVTDDDTAALEVIDPSITLEKTVYEGHDGGAGCDGGELVTGLPGDDVTYCFTITNAAGQGPLTDVDLNDLDLDDAGLTLVSGDVTPAGRRPVGDLLPRDRHRRGPGQHRFGDRHPAGRPGRVRRGHRRGRRGQRRPRAGQERVPRPHERRRLRDRR